MHPDTLNLSDNDIKGSHFGHVSLTIIIIIGIQPLGRSGQRPEFS